ncbi:hypothetical protein [Acinetobacter larvae]|nr:hypothetical protein [Acinetobacter larvae]
MKLKNRAKLTDLVLSGISTGVSYGAYGVVVGVDKPIIYTTKPDGSLELDPDFNDFKAVGIGLGTPGLGFDFSGSKAVYNIHTMEKLK